MRFRDRTDAGRQLAQRLAEQHLVDPIVLALPRGGVPVGFEVAKVLGAPLEVFVARKVGAPDQPELGIGAISEGTGLVIDRAAVRMFGVSPERLDSLIDDERQELERRVCRYRGSRLIPNLEERDVIVVDDGLATGVTAEAALRALQAHRPGRLVLAVPVCAPDTAARLRSLADDVTFVMAPDDLRAVGRWYERFEQTTDDEVLDLLARAGQPASRR
jgi:putative phosphoribosyl transferase